MGINISFLPPYKFYEDKNEIKNYSNRSRIPLISEILIHYK